MARLAARGTTNATPYRPQSDLAGRLADLHVSDAFDEDGLTEVYSRFGQIVGRWMAEEGRLDSKEIAEALISMSKQLDKIGAVLKGHETGLRDAADSISTSGAHGT